MQNGPFARKKYSATISNVDSAIGEIQSLLSNNQVLQALDLLEHLAEWAPHLSEQILASAYSVFQSLPDNESRYSLYQSRYFDFPITQGDKVLDIGSGHLPLPMATHLADFATEDHAYGRAGIPFKHIKGLPVFNCSVEEMPFKDKEFDFVYCSHVLEHVSDPITACKELMRVAKRGYLETPTRAKDLFLNTAKISNHNWMVEYFNERLIFTEYTPRQLDGLSTNLLMSMHCEPQTDREKAFSALVLLKSDQLNTMLMWEGGFDVEVRRIGKDPEFYYHASEPQSIKPLSTNPIRGAQELFC